MNQYPPGDFIGVAIKTLPAPGPDVPLQTLDIDAGPLWGRYRVVFAAKRNPRRGMRSWFWAGQSGKQIAPPTQKYQHYLLGEVLNEKARWRAVRILLSPEDALTFLAIGGRDLEQHPRVLALLDRAMEVADVRKLVLLPVAID